MRITTRIWAGVNGKSLAIGLTTFFAIIAFTVTGVTSSMQGLDANVAAKVGDQIISMKTLQGVVQRQSRRDGGDEASRNANIKNALDSLIQETVIVEESSRIGWKANDIEVAYWIKNIPSFQDEKTKIFDKKKYDEFIKSGQMSELELFQEGRNSISAQKYAALLNLDSHIPEALAKEYAKKSEARFNIEFIEVAAKDDDVKKSVAEKTSALLADATQLESLQKNFEAKKAEYNRPASPRISSLLIAFKDAAQAQGDALNRTKEDAQKKATELLAKLKSTGTEADFGSVSDANNDDIKAKGSKGDIGFVDENSLDPKSLDAARALASDGQVSEIIETEFGFRIMKRTAYRAAVNKTFDDVKQELAEKQVRPEVSSRLNQELVAKFETILASENKDISSLVTESRLSWQPVKEPVTSESRFITEIGLAEPVIKSIFQLRTKGQILPKVVQVSGKQVVVRLVDRQDTETDAAKIKSTTDIKLSELRQSFATESKRKLYDIFSQNREIKRNATLIQAN